MTAFELPIHTSDRGTFKSCRRKWDYVSPMRRNLTPKVSSAGVQFNLWFGTGIHKVLEEYYHANREIDPVLTWQVWFDDQMAKLNEAAPGYPDENSDEFHELYMLGQGMMEHYSQWSRANDDFHVIHSEHDFSVPLGFTQYDRRTNLELPVMYKGRMDLVICDETTGRYGIMDHKTSARIDEEFFIKLEMDEQCTSYLWAAQREAEMGLYYGEKPDFVYYNVLRKAYPKPPTVTSRGLLSIDRQKESTTLEMFREAAEKLRLIGTDWWLSEKVVDYREHLKEERFIIRHKVLRNKHQIWDCGERIKLEAQDMLNAPYIYPNPNGTYGCIYCAFRAPCLAEMDGSDFEYILQENYESNKDRGIDTTEKEVLA